MNMKLLKMLRDYAVIPRSFVPDTPNTGSISNSVSDYVSDYVLYLRR